MIFFFDQFCFVHLSFFSCLIQKLTLIPLVPSTVIFQRHQQKQTLQLFQRNFPCFIFFPIFLFSFLTFFSCRFSLLSIFYFLFFFVKKRKRKTKRKKENTKKHTYIFCFFCFSSFSFSFFFLFFFIFF